MARFLKPAAGGLEPGQRPAELLGGLVRKNEVMPSGVPAAQDSEECERTRVSRSKLVNGSIRQAHEPAGREPVLALLSVAPRLSRDADYLVVG